MESLKENDVLFYSFFLWLFCGPAATFRVSIHETDKKVNEETYKHLLLYIFVVVVLINILLFSLCLSLSFSFLFTLYKTFTVYILYMYICICMSTCKRVQDVDVEYYDTLVVERESIFILIDLNWQFIPVDFVLVAALPFSFHI